MLKSMVSSMSLYFSFRAGPQLAEPMRVVVVLHYFEDFDLLDIAQLLGIPLGTVKFRLHSARRKLARILTQTFSVKTSSN